jgi:hypothetical protein
VDVPGKKSDVTARFLTSVFIERTSWLGSPNETCVGRRDVGECESSGVLCPFQFKH